MNLGNAVTERPNEPPPTVPPPADASPADPVPSGPLPANGPSPAGAGRPYVPEYLTYASTTVFPYESARPRARIVVGLLWALLPVHVLSVWPYLREISEVRRAAAAGPGATAGAGGGAVADLLSVTGVAFMSLGLVHVLLYVVMLVFWAMWVHRTYRNLPPLGADGLSYTPGWAVAYNFIPIVHLFRPFQVMRETWRASDPRHAGGIHWMTVRVPTLVGVWWAMHVVSVLASLVSGGTGAEIDERRWDLREAVAWVGLCVLALDSAIVLVAIRLVNRLTDLQEARAAALTPPPFAAPAGAPPAAVPAGAAVYGAPLVPPALIHQSREPA